MSENNKQKYFGGFRKDIIPLIPKNIHNLLDVGCGYGVTAFNIKNLLGNVEIHGIENNQHALEIANKKLDRVFNIDLNYDNKTLDNFLDNKYDCILCLDVLEHLINPDLILINLAQKLSIKGRIIISLPNISHYTVLIPLIFKDDFKYQEKGILDKTHLKFFTKKSIEDMISRSGLSIKHSKVNIQANRKLLVLNKILFKSLNRFLTFQYIFVCVKD